jgi:hypothetical protein
MTIYLYIKTHNKTGLKYFGKTVSKNPRKYKGSGLLWTRHINKHGNDVNTEIYGEYIDSELAKKDAIKFSTDNNIVESSDWANLKIECLDGGWDHINSLSNKERRNMFFNWWDKLTDYDKEIINKKKARSGEDNYWHGKDRSGDKNPRFGVHDDYKTYKKISKANKNKIVVKDAITNVTIGFIDKNHPNIQNGTWVSINKGKSHTDEFKKNRSIEYKARGIKPPSAKGKLWWTNGKIVIRSETSPGKEFVRGRRYSI